MRTWNQIVQDRPGDEEKRTIMALTEALAEKLGTTRTAALQSISARVEELRVSQVGLYQEIMEAREKGDKATLREAKEQYDRFVFVLLEPEDGD